MAIQTFQLPYSESAVQDLRERLARTRWPDTIPGSGWEYGFDLEYLQSICRYWREKFDWKAQIARLSRFSHLQTSLKKDDRLGRREKCRTRFSCKPL